MRGLMIGVMGLTLGIIPTAAQAQPVTGYTLAVYLRGGDAPTVTHAVPAAEVVCGQPRQTAPAVVANPRYVRWNDPSAPALDCVWDSGATAGPLFALPFSPTQEYDATLRAVNTAGASPESARSNPFSRPGVAPAVLSGLRVLPGS